VTEPLLSVEGISVHYGQNVALEDVSLSVGPGEIVALLGANGSGKTTLALAISGLVPLRSGRIMFDGADLRRLRPYQRARLGLAHIPEGRGVLRDLTVKENLVLGAAAGAKRSAIPSVMQETLEQFPRLKERLNQLAGTLSGGEQQMLVFARAILSRPRLLVLDEPSLGLAPRLVAQTFQLIKGYAEGGAAVLLIEQNIALSLEVAHRGYVLATGHLRLSGEATSLRNDPIVQEAYLGGDIAERV
jgi:branched-chain amino acid transport system ATP-binding protein